MGIIDRILQFIDYKGFSKREFYITTSLSNGFLDKVNKIGSDKIEKILSVYPEISAEWLVTGKGEMLLSENEKAISGIEKTMDCKKCEILEQENDYLKQIIEAKDETIRAYKSTCDDKNNGDYRTIA